MITEHEFNIANDSYVKKDFYQIYPEILSLVTKITEKWDPESSNESDPGVVLLKLLAFIADKNNYNIDKNILECFMPSLTQEESMRRICDMMGYDMHYYKSSSTNLSVMWSGALEDSEHIEIPRFTAITSSDKENVKYITVEPLVLNDTGVKKDVLVLEGTAIDLLVGDTDIIRLYNLDDNNRIYLPEPIVAENGIFILPIDEKEEEHEWRPVNNLYTHTAGSYIYKFGYDSSKKLPYIEFPDDIDKLIGNGLKIKYVRTSGAAGNIKAKVLNKVESISNVYKVNTTSIEKTALTDDDESNLVIANLSSAITGEDIETIDQAYNNFKKTVGTFDTLVTCRDYANAIYNMVDNTVAQNPLVSNCQVSDIRDDLNKSYRIMTFNSFGVCFKDLAITDTDKKPLITPFEIYIYPFSAMTGGYTASSYNQSFKNGSSAINSIKQQLEENKTISHEIKEVTGNNLFAIKNYYKLYAKINTNYKVNKAEQKEILDNIQEALFKKFNAREVDFGEELVYEEILKTIQEADTRIKNIQSLDYDITVKAMNARDEEEILSSAEFNGGSDNLYADLIVKNILAGRIDMFKRIDNINHDFGEQKITGLNSEYGQLGELVETQGTGYNADKKLFSANTSFKLPISAIPEDDTGYELKNNENIIFISENYVDDYIYAFGTNYNWTGGTIAANSEHKLTGDEKLYIKYTDPDGKIICILYGPDNYIKWVNGVEGQPTPWSGIIKPNFDLQNSLDYVTDYYRGSWPVSLVNTPTSWASIGGFVSLSTKQQLSVLKEQIDLIPSNETQSYYPILWVTKSGNIENGHILEEGEYFFYTDITKTTLLTYGSGTKIELLDTNGNPLPTGVLNKPSNKDVDIDKIANEGLNAIAAADWYNFNPAASTIKTIRLTEMRTLNLGAGSKIITLSLADSETALDNTFKKVSGTVKYQFADTDSPAPLPVIASDWYVRSRLNLNIGPNLTQVFEKDRYHNLTLTVKDQSTQPIPICSSSSTVNGISLRCNYLIQEAGSDNISLATFVEDNTLATGFREVDDVIITVFQEVPVTTDVTGQTIELNNFENNYTSLPTTLSEVTLPVSIPDNAQGLMFVYTELKTSDIGTITISVTGDTGAEIDYYNPVTASTAGTSQTLKSGLNVFKLTNKVKTITITKSSTVKDRLVIFSGVTAVSTDYYGIDLEHLGFSTTNSTTAQAIAAYILAFIKEVAGDEFCYNAVLDNNFLVNYDPTEYQFWSDPNNITRKYTLPQLDTDLSNIKISEGSKLK